MPPENIALKLLGVTIAVGALPVGKVKVPIVTGSLNPMDEKLFVPPWVVAFDTIKVVRVRREPPVSFAPSANASEPVIGAAVAAPAQATAAAAKANTKVLVILKLHLKLNAPQRASTQIDNG